MTPDQALAFISSQNTIPPLTQFAIDLNGEAIGHIEIILQSDVYRKSAELGCWLAEPYWGKGLAKQAVVLMLTHAFIKFDLNRIYARIFANNRQSQRLVESVGFILEGKLSDAVYKSGEFQDELIYSIRRLR
jgi:ribosomal-protein-alanine N-acetyltransferase